MKKEKIIEALRRNYGGDLESLFGETLEEMLWCVITNYYNDHKTNWEEVNSVQSIDFMAIIVKLVLDEIGGK
jgi:hypothetical protein